MIKARAIIDWVPAEAGGRRRPPSGEGPQPYATVVHFRGTPQLGEAPVSWSLVVEKVKMLSEPSCWLADVRCLVDEAPHELLRPGAEFGLYEGKKCVARGRISGELSPAPADDVTGALKTAVPR